MVVQVAQYVFIKTLKTIKISFHLFFIIIIVVNEPNN